MTEYQLIVWRERGRVRHKTILFAETLWQAMEMAHSFAGEDEWDLLPLGDVVAAQALAEKQKQFTRH